ncbi:MULTISPECIES: hypothetical protein [unclassified Streptomyces]|uniref:hypothetical protein n=1 Tax=unclassified Streptomyces TaxID=2593676 RepID=UPI0012FF0ABA|nr:MULTISPECIES: hypothetical protein [unclassified Streptomyces]
MPTPDPPRRTPGSSRQTHTSPEPPPGAPSRPLRLRAAAGWARFMRRAEVDVPVEEEPLAEPEAPPPGPAPVQALARART